MVIFFFLLHIDYQLFMSKLLIINELILNFIICFLNNKVKKCTPYYNNSRPTFKFF